MSLRRLALRRVVTVVLAAATLAGPSQATAAPPPPRPTPRPATASGPAR